VTREYAPKEAAGKGSRTPTALSDQRILSPPRELIARSESRFQHLWGRAHLGAKSTASHIKPVPRRRRAIPPSRSVRP
jgi:hypothetical protein